MEWGREPVTVHTMFQSWANSFSWEASIEEGLHVRSNPKLGNVTYVLTDKAIARLEETNGFDE